MSLRPKVIIVDDEQGILDALERLFEFEDIDTYVTSDPDEALRVLGESSVKVFISDYRMPMIDGVTLLKKVYDQKPNVKRILLTGQAGIDNIAEALNKAHIFRYISKPWDDIDLLHTIEEAENVFDLELENKHLLLVTQRQLSALQALDKLKSDFIANVSHELRTPVNCLNLVIENILDGVAGDFDEFNPMMKKYIKKSKNNIDNLKAIIDDLLDIFKLSDDDFRLNKQIYNVSELLHNECYACYELFDNKNIIFKENIMENISLDIDIKRLGQVIRNLLSNAIKFTDDGGMVEVGLCVNKDTTSIYVKDSGKGIPKEDLERIFDRFSQVEDKVSGKPVGTGLGLAISRRIIQLHEGIIRAESELGQGTCFYIDLPIKNRSNDD